MAKLLNFFFFFFLSSRCLTIRALSILYESADCIDPRDIIVEQQEVFVITKVHGVEENAFQNVVRILQEHETLELPGVFGAHHLNGLFGTWLRSSCIYGISTE